MPPNSGGTESESILESDLDPDLVLARKKVLATKSGGRLPPKAKSILSKQSLTEKGGPSKKGSEVILKKKVYYRISRRNVAWKVKSFNLGLDSGMSDLSNQPLFQKCSRVG